MIILALRTDKPESEVGLYDDEQELAYETWPAHRELAETIHKKINHLLSLQGLTLQEVQGIVAYKGPGSFTGLRIGLAVANALAYGLNIPIVGETGNWIEQGIEKLLAGVNDQIVIPEYGAPPHVTQQKK